MLNGKYLKYSEDITFEVFERIVKKLKDNGWTFNRENALRLYNSFIKRLYLVYDVPKNIYGAYSLDCIKSKDIEIQVSDILGEDWNKSKELTKDDLIENEIYYHKENNNICKWGIDDSTCGLGDSSTTFSNGSGSYHSGVFYKATSHQKKWLNVCIKQDKFIKESELDNYDDEFNLKKSMPVDDLLEVGESVIVTEEESNNAPKLGQLCKITGTDLHSNVKYCVKDYKKLYNWKVKESWIKNCRKATQEEIDTIKSPKTKEYVNVRSQEEWDYVTKKLVYKWISGSWGDYEEESCIYLKNQEYSCVDGCAKDKYYTFQEWLDLNNYVFDKPEIDLEGRYIKCIDDHGLIQYPCHVGDYLKFSYCNGKTEYWGGYVKGEKKIPDEPKYWGTEAHKMSCFELMPEGFEPELKPKTFEFNKWYKDPNSKWLVFIESKTGGYGFSQSGAWFSGNDSGWLKGVYTYPKATTEEVESRLLEYASKHYPIGTKYKVLGSDIFKGEIYTSKRNPEMVGNNSMLIEVGVGYCYCGGKWAEVINESTTSSLQDQFITTDKPKEFDRNWYVKVNSQEEADKVLAWLESQGEKVSSILDDKAYIGDCDYCYIVPKSINNWWVGNSSHIKNKIERKLSDIIPEVKGTPPSGLEVNNILEDNIGIKIEVDEDVCAYCESHILGSPWQDSKGNMCEGCYCDQALEEYNDSIRGGLKTNKLKQIKCILLVEEKIPLVKATKKVIKKRIKPNYSLL